ncbi:hypothetical protein BDV10DRAFT_185692 [Aspergillus recurvatus]
MTLLICVCLLLASFTGALGTPVSTTTTTTSCPSTPLFAFDLSCTDLSTFNNAMVPFLNLTPPSGTPEMMVPHVNRRLSAISSFVSGYQNMMNTFNMNNCAGSGETSLQARQTDPIGPIVQAICDALAAADTTGLPQEVIDLIDAIETALGCSEETV